MNTVFTIEIFLVAFVCFAELKLIYNTFPQQVSRVTIHVPKVLSRTCLLKPDPGPCRANIDMYYFVPSKMTCEVFPWGGCQGNGNRFDSNMECQDFCLSKATPSQSRPRYCNLSFDYGFCFGDVKRWYYDHLWKVCKETIYSGCGGNKNNFYNKEECESICRFGRGRLPRPSPDKDRIKKILIINPPNTTPSRGKDQETLPPSLSP